MKVRFEKVGRDGASSIKAFRHGGPAFDGIFHYHPEAELVWIVAGRGRRLIGDNLDDFVPGELLLIAPNLPHLFASECGGGGVAATPSQAVVAQWRGDFLGADSGPEREAMDRLLQRAGGGLRFAPGDVAPLGEAVEALPALRGLERLGAFLGLLARLSGMEGRTLSSPRHAPMLDHHASERVGRVCAWVLAHLDQRLGLEEAARRAHLSPSAFSRLFRRCTGKTFSAFVIECRVAHAQMLLRESALSVLEISLEAGFRNLANFNRQFRRLSGTTPREYRTRWSRLGPASPSAR